MEKEANKQSLKKYGRWIPGEAYYNPDITLLDGALFGLILSLTKKDGVCTASNDYLAKDLHVAKITIQKSLAYLEKHKYIKRRVIKDENQLVIERQITIDPKYEERYREMLIKEIEQRGVKKNL